MPHVPRMLPADRFFARVEKFTCECPNCGEVIMSGRNPRKIPKRRRTEEELRYIARTQRKSPTVAGLIWNPFTQRLACPWCNNVFILGLMAYPLGPGRRRLLDAPPDTLPTKRQRLAMRRAGNGWWAERSYTPAQEVNVVIDHNCSCPEKGWRVNCPVHGDPAFGGGAETLAYEGIEAYPGAQAAAAKVGP